MKPVLLIVVSLLIFTSVSFADSVWDASTASPMSEFDCPEVKTVESLACTMQGWEPKRITINNQGEATVITGFRQIEAVAYETIVLAGMCPLYGMYPNSLKGIKKATILNQFGAQGFIFKGGAKECSELNKLEKNKESYTRRKQVLAGYTELYFKHID